MLNGKGRGRSLERFEESKKRLEPPAWMTNQPLKNAVDYKTPSRIRYSEHRRSYSAQRSNTASSGLWLRNSNSRGPSPLPGSRPATAGGRFHEVSSSSHQSFSRWSASTLCSETGSNAGDNTPTDSVISAFSMRSSVQGMTEPMYPPPPLPRPNTAAYHYPHHQRRPYLGWRSQDSLNDNDRGRGGRGQNFLSPAERLAYTYRQTSSLLPGQPQQPQQHDLLRCPQGNSRASFEQKFLHDSIKSVSSAIMEFCNAEDVPQPPPVTTNYNAKNRNNCRASAEAKEPHHRTKIIWLESSFVSSSTVANGETKSKL